MGIFSWIVLGLIAGALARYILPGRQGGGILWTTVVGILGGVVGGWIGTRMGFGSIHHFDLRSIAIAIGGAMLVLVVYDAVVGRR